MRFVVFSVYMAKAIRNLSCFNKKNLVFLIRNISSKELHSALGKISVVNLMYNLLGIKNCSEKKGARGGNGRKKGTNAGKKNKFCFQFKNDLATLNMTKIRLLN
jgi:hypothetical protein